jgi:hypothetical protein
MTVSFIGVGNRSVTGENHRPVHVTDKRYHY